MGATKDIQRDNLDYDRPIELLDGIHWVGFDDPVGGFYCNPYLIIDGDQAVLIDGGSRPDFSTVMRKIMQTGIDPRSISHLIYQHYDPDLCGSIPNLEDIIDRPDLRLITKKENIGFIRHYAVRSEIVCIDTMGWELRLTSGRILTFHPTPYAHSSGSFMTHDETTGTLFTSDLFGSVSSEKTWDLFLELNPDCLTCTKEMPEGPIFHCGHIEAHCPWPELFQFHRQVMTSNRALRNALDEVRKIMPRMIAPQHGSIFFRAGDIKAVIERLAELDDVGIDGLGETRDG